MDGDPREICSLYLKLSRPSPRQALELPQGVDRAVVGARATSQGAPSHLLLCFAWEFQRGREVSEGQEQKPQNLQARSWRCTVDSLSCLPLFQKKKQVPGGAMGSLQPLWLDVPPGSRAAQASILLYYLQGAV